MNNDRYQLIAVFGEEDQVILKEDNDLPHIQFFIPRYKKEYNEAEIIIFDSVSGNEFRNGSWRK